MHRYIIATFFLVSLCCVVWSAAAPAVLAMWDSVVCIRVWNGDVPCQRFAFGSREERYVIMVFAIVSLLCCPTYVGRP